VSGASGLGADADNPDDDDDTWDHGGDRSADGDGRDRRDQELEHDRGPPHQRTS
jgi:hypothetical protein